MATYSQVADLLIGDLTAQTDEKERVVRVATDEINGVLGARYVIPLTLSATDTLVLARCCNLIATGRFILARAASSPDLHPYGMSCLQEGQGILMQILNGEIVLEGSTPTEAQTSGNAPAITNYDETSSVDAFYAWSSAPNNTGLVYGTVPIWQPGTPA